MRTLIILTRHIGQIKEIYLQILIESMWWQMFSKCKRETEKANDVEVYKIEIFQKITQLKLLIVEMHLPDYIFIKLVRDSW